MDLPARCLFSSQCNNKTVKSQLPLTKSKKINKKQLLGNFNLEK